MKHILHRGKFDRLEKFKRFQCNISTNFNRGSLITALYSVFILNIIKSSMKGKAPTKFKTPDGKEFDTRAEWRDYMMATFYSYKNKHDEPEPLIKPVHLLHCAIVINYFIAAWKY